MRLKSYRLYRGLQSILDLEASAIAFKLGTESTSD
jgi:hypothetical protein